MRLSASVVAYSNKFHLGSSCQGSDAAAFALNAAPWFLLGLFAIATAPFYALIPLKKPLSPFAIGRALRFTGRILKPISGYASVGAAFL